MTFRSKEMPERSEKGGLLFRLSKASLMQFISGMTILVSLFVLLAAVHLVFASCPCGTLPLLTADVSDVGISSDAELWQPKRLGTLVLSMAAAAVSTAAQRRDHRLASFVARAICVMAMLFASAPYMPPGAVRLIFAWTIFYIFAAWVAKVAARGATVVWCGEHSSELWHLIVALVHNLGSMSVLLILMVMYPPENWSLWLTGRWSDVLDHNSLPLHVFASIMAAMVRDLLVCEQEFNTIAVGMLAHHFATIGGCILSFASPGGVGTHALNGINLELGSATYSILLLIPLDERWRLVRSVYRPIYWVGMTVSNFLAIYLALQWYAKLPIFWAWPCVYSSLGAVLGFLRQAGILLTVRDAQTISTVKLD